MAKDKTKKELQAEIEAYKEKEAILKAEVEKNARENLAALTGVGKMTNYLRDDIEETSHVIVRNQADRTTSFKEIFKRNIDGKKSGHKLMSREDTVKLTELLKFKSKGGGE